MRYRTGNELKDYLKDMAFHAFGKRDCISVLFDYLQNPSNSDTVMVITGLRRTGKTTMMYQSIAELNDYENTVLIRCNVKDNIENIVNTILDSPAKYVFLDEVTKVPDFIDMCSSLADDCAASGKKIVMAGTDSLGFTIVKKGELEGRMKEIHTTYIPYSEWKRLVNKDIFAYMKYGGTLCEENVFYNEDTLDEYSNTAIASNILHTLQYWDHGENKNALYPALTKEDILSLINYYLREETKQFLAENIEEFKAKEYHSVAQMYQKKRKEIEKGRIPEEYTPDPSVLKNEELASELQRQLCIKDEYSMQIDKPVIEKLRNFLIHLEVLIYLKETGQYYFTQPGMRYCHIDAALETLKNNKTVCSLYSTKDIEMVSEKIRNDVEGNLLEDIVLLNCRYFYKDNKDVVVRKYRAINQEYDVVVIDKKNSFGIALEVKRSDQKDTRQKKHLIDQELKDDFERDTGIELLYKAVIYSGASEKDDDDFQYINNSEFLDDIEASFLKYFQAAPGLGILKKNNSESGDNGNQDGTDSFNIPLSKSNDFHEKDITDTSDCNGSGNESHNADSPKTNNIENPGSIKAISSDKDGPDSDPDLDLDPEKDLGDDERDDI
ncbi:MAG: AAA family ATPase [Lachnospiraceae bacterium]|nr:AAA family ATPase [Lachnospiraceae bacterium]